MDGGYVSHCLGGCDNGDVHYTNMGELTMNGWVVLATFVFLVSMAVALGFATTWRILND